MINLKNKNLEISLHLLIWLVLFFLPAAFTIGSETDWSAIFRHFWLQLFFLAIIFYLNYFIIVKWLFEDKKLWFFASNFLLLILLIFVKSQIFELLEPDRPKMLGKRPPEALRYFFDFLIYLIPVAFSIAINASKKNAESRRNENRSR